MSFFNLNTKLISFLFVSTFFVFLPANANNRDSLKILITNSYKSDIFDNHKDVLRYSTELYYLGKNKNDYDSMLFSLFEQSRLYLMENRYGITLRRLHEGIALAKKMSNYNMLCRFTLIYIKVLTQLDYNDKDTRTLINKCIEFNNYVNNEDDRRTNSIYILIAQADSYVNNEGLSENMNNVVALKIKAYNESLKLKNENPLKIFTQIYSLQSLSWSCALSRKFDYAKRYLDIIDSLLAKNPNYYFNVDCLITKGAIENINRNHLGAISYFKQAIEKSEKSQAIFQLYTVFPMISASYGELGDYKQGMEYSWKEKEMGERLRLLKIEGHNASIITKLNREIREVDNTKTNKYLLVFSIGMLLLFITACIYIKLTKRKSNVKKIRTKLDLKYINFSEEPEKLVFDSDNLINSDDNKKLVNLAKEDINTFYIEFEKIYPFFHHILKEKFPEMNLSDINFCSLIKMKFDIKEIAIFTNTTLRSVESRRYRIRKKMNLQGQDDLYIIISNIN